jgi:hypothetical protein
MTIGSVRRQGRHRPQSGSAHRLIQAVDPPFTTPRFSSMPGELRRMRRASRRPDSKTSKRLAKGDVDVAVADGC